MYPPESRSWESLARLTHQTAMPFKRALAGLISTNGVETCPRMRKLSNAHMANVEVG